MERPLISLLLLYLALLIAPWLLIARIPPIGVMCLLLIFVLLDAPPRPGRAPL
jgi:hypothetical protein